MFLVCTETGDWVGDVLEVAGAWRRYHVGIVDNGCKAGHRHMRPPGHKVAAKMAEARRRNTSVPLNVHPMH